MKDIPIIFSGPMVRSLWDDRKRMTRRLLQKPVPEPPAMDAVHPSNVAKHAAPYLDAYCSERPSLDNPRGMSRNWCWWTRDDRQCLPTVNVRYAPGDRLWVRENFKTTFTLDKKSMQAIANEALDAGYRRPWCPIKYEADGSTDNWTATDWGDFGKGRPCIFMPRWASRLTLIVTGVKVERLQDMPPDDAIAEGMKGVTKDGKLVKYGLPDRDGLPGTDDDGWPWHEWRISPVDAFEKLWTSLHGHDSWAVNPYVVALTFTVHKQNIDALPKARAA